jgi:hypothetical protein
MPIRFVINGPRPMYWNEFVFKNTCCSFGKTRTPNNLQFLFENAWRWVSTVAAMHGDGSRRFRYLLKCLATTWCDGVSTKKHACMKRPPPNTCLAEWCVMVCFRTYKLDLGCNTHVQQIELAWFHTQVMKWSKPNCATHVFAGISIEPEHVCFVPALSVSSPWLPR